MKLENVHRRKVRNHFVCEFVKLLSWAHSWFGAATRIVGVRSGPEGPHRLCGRKKPNLSTGVKPHLDGSIALGAHAMTRYRALLRELPPSDPCRM